MSLYEVAVNRLTERRQLAERDQSIMANSGYWFTENVNCDRGGFRLGNEVEKDALVL